MLPWSSTLSRGIPRRQQMVPACRTEGKEETLPPFALAHGDVEGFLHELRGFHEAFRECFTRLEPREHFFRSMVGQLSPLERKSIEPMALEVDGGNVRGMQRFMSDAIWDEAQMRRIYQQLVYDEMGDADGVVIVDESGFAKKGRDSVGVARQYCRTLGKVENCQVGVFAAYASRHGYALVDTRLFMHEAWCIETSAARRTKCGVPEDIRFQTKPQLAIAMLRELRDEGVLPFRYVVAECVYGHSSEFLEAIEEEASTIYFVSIPTDTRCWREGPVMQTKQYTYQGERRTKWVASPLEKEPIAVETLAKSLHNCFWYRRQVAEGTKGPIEYEFTKRQVTLCGDGRPTRAV